MKTAVGSYVGNGTTQTVTVTGLTPDFVMIKGGANSAVSATSTMGVDQTKSLTGATALFAGGITALAAGSFSVGADARVNASGVTYHYLAVENNGVFDVDVFSWVGDGTDDRLITPDNIIGPPAVVIVFPENAITAIWYSNFHVDGLGDDIGSTPFGNTQALFSAVKRILPGGFEIGPNTATNTSGVVYHAVCFKDAPGLFKALGYVADALDNRSVTGIGFQPDFALVKSMTAPLGALASAVRFIDQVGDDSALTTAVASAADRIQAFESDGFQIGTSGNVNQSSGRTYTAFGIKIGTSSGAGSCGAVDVALVLDIAGLAGIDTCDLVFISVPTLKATLSNIVQSSGGDYQLAVVTFTDQVFIDLQFSAQNVVAARSVLDGLVDSGVGGSPEASDEAIRTALQDLSPAFRPAARKILVLITDSLPAGLDGLYTEGVDDVNAHNMALLAASLGVQIIAVQYTAGGVDPTDPVADAKIEEIMRDYADTTQGAYIRLGTVDRFETFDVGLYTALAPLLDCGGLPPLSVITAPTFALTI